MKVTVPVGVPVPEVGVTVAVNVTLCPNTLGLAEETTAVVVPVKDEFTVWLNVLDVLLLKFVSAP